MNEFDRSYENVILFEMGFLPNIVFLGCYITPRDSPYYDGAMFGYIKSIIKKDVGKTVCYWRSEQLCWYPQLTGLLVMILKAIVWNGDLE